MSIISKEKTLIIKGIAILFVIISHCGLLECGGPIGVDLFLIVSGYGIYKSYHKKREFYWKKRVLAVYFPYLFVTILFLVVRLIAGVQMDFDTIIISILGLDFNKNIDPSMWYISYSMVMYLIAYVFFRMENKKVFSLFLLGSGILITTLFGYKHICWHQGTIAWAYGLSFPMGLLAAKFERALIEKIKWIGFFSFVLSFVLVFVEYKTYMKLILPLAISVTIIVIVAHIDLPVRVFSYIGCQSYFMYLVEAVVIGMVAQYISEGLLLFVISVLLSLTLAIILSKIYDYIMMRLGKGNL